jgi:Mg2+ and Co2+ transporter CorA
VRRNGALQRAERVEPEWLDPSSGTTVWVDLAAPAGDEFQLLADTFHLHPLSVEDARSSLQFPKAEPYPGYLYVVLHGINVRKGKQAFATRTSTSSSARTGWSRCTTASPRRLRTCASCASGTTGCCRRGRWGCSTASWTRWWTTIGR